MTNVGRELQLNDSEDEWWKPGELDWRFTEDNPHYQQINKKMTRAQFSPEALRQMTDEDLVYVAGHTHEPWDADPHSQEAWDRVHKSKQNAERARVELQRRYAAKLARTTFWRTVALSVLSLIVGALLTVILTEATEDDPQAPAGVTVP
jgi:hypothetical protein